MGEQTIIGKARRAARLSQRELARRAGTSQPTLSTYETGVTSPTLVVAERIVASSGFDLTLSAHVAFSEVYGTRGEPYAIPDRLWRLDIADAVAVVELPRHVHWSGPSRSYDLGDREDRARVYEIVLREGSAGDLRRFIDGAFLLDLWDELVLPRPLRNAWDPVITAAHPPQPGARASA